MKAYPEYKRTGLPWIESIPSHWQIRRNKYLLTEINERTENGSAELLRVSQYTGITPKRNSLSNVGMHSAESTVGYKVVQPSDIVMNIMLAWNGSTGASRYAGVVSPAYAVFRTCESVNPWYFHHLFRTKQMTSFFKANSTGVIESRLRLYPEVLFSITSILPTIEEQNKIVSYLDWQTSRINKLINIKKRQIDLLEEKKQSTIYHAVTKGLNETISKKDSKISWIGFYPDTWRITCIGHVYNTILGKMLASSATYDDDLLLEYVCAKDVHFDGVDLTTLKKMYFSKGEIKSYSVATGDLLVVEGGAGAGGAAVVTDEIDRQIMIQNSIHRVRAKKGISTNEYLYYWLFSLVKRGYMEFCTNVATIPHYTKEKLAATPMPLPSVDEQKKIVKFLDKKCGEIDLIISKINDQIEKLHEYQTRLISYVVTGQVDVRDVEVPEYETVEEIVDIEDEFIDNIEDIE